MKRPSPEPTARLFKRALTKLFSGLKSGKRPFSHNKCKVMDVKFRISNHVYSMKMSPLLTVEKESDLAVAISSDLKHNKHCKLACRKANTLLEFTSRNFN